MRSIHISEVFQCGGSQTSFVEYVRDKRFDGETHYPLLGSINPVAEFIRGIASFYCSTSTFPY